MSYAVLCCAVCTMCVVHHVVQWCTDCCCYLNDCMILPSQTIHRLWCNTDDHHKQMLIASSEQIHCTVAVSRHKLIATHTC